MVMKKGDATGITLAGIKEETASQIPSALEMRRDTNSGDRVKFLVSQQLMSQFSHYV
jgi:hypothetical protein